MPRNFPTDIPDNHGLSYSKEWQDYKEKETAGKERAEELELLRQQKEFQLIEAKERELEKEIERQERIKERKSDRQFTWLALVIAILGLLLSLVDFIF